MDIAAIYVRKKYIDKGIPEKEIGVFYVTQCAAKIAAIKCPVGEESSPVDGVINMDFIYNKILPGSPPGTGTIPSDSAIHPMDPLGRRSFQLSGALPGDRRNP